MFDLFIDLKKILPNIFVNLAYASTDNFTGSIVPGYLANRALLTAPAATALKTAFNQLEKKSLTLKVFDAYRPLKAVHYFYHDWSLLPDDTILKNYYYPTLSKSDLFEKGYLSKRSSHCRGSTVDLTICDLQGNDLDMGSPFDFFGEKSHTTYKNLNKIQRDNRVFLLDIMKNAGFKNYSKEWWHFTLIDEPYPDHYFDQDII